MKELQPGISFCANANPEYNSGFMLDQQARNVLFGPYLQRVLNKLEGALVFGHGEVNADTNGKLHVVANLRDLYEIFGARRDEWESGYLPYALLHGGCPAVSIFMVEPGVDLFQAAREFVDGDFDYPYHTALKWALSLIAETAKYEPYASEEARLAEINGPEQDRLRKLCDQLSHNIGPQGVPGPAAVGIIHSGRLRVGKEPSYRDLGRSSNARKRWPK